jgi:hypothetical protein
MGIGLIPFAISMGIVMLVVHVASPSVIAVHRFFEVSLGIAVGLGMTRLWPERMGQIANDEG